MTLPPSARLLPIRLHPGDDLRRALEAALPSDTGGAFVLSATGSLSDPLLRMAGASNPRSLQGPWEILTLAGSVARNGAHLHASLSDANGAVLGGHVAYGCKVRTTAEVLLVLLDEWDLTREADTATGEMELAVRPRES